MNEELKYEDYMDEIFDGYVEEFFRQAEVVRSEPADESHFKLVRYTVSFSYEIELKAIVKILQDRYDGFFDGFARPENSLNCEDGDFYRYVVCVVLFRLRLYDIKNYELALEGIARRMIKKANDMKSSEWFKKFQQKMKQN